VSPVHHQPDDSASSDREQAFRAVFAQHLGFKSSEALQARNAQVHAQNSAIRRHHAALQREIRAALQQACSGDSRLFNALLDRNPLSCNFAIDCNKWITIARNKNSSCSA
jgi:hypothetical protein